MMIVLVALFTGFTVLALALLIFELQQHSEIPPKELNEDDAAANIRPLGNVTVIHNDGNK